MSLAPKSKHWQPSATVSLLQKRAAILNRIRAFFMQRGVLEVETPLMCRTSVTDPFIESIPALYSAHPGEPAEKFYLQTSPEYAMKRLLAAGSGSIFQLCKAFRQSENGRLHNPEFTMLEWYRVDFNQMQLIDEVDQLLQMILGTSPATRITYSELYKHHFDIDIHHVTSYQLQDIAKQHDIYIDDDQLDNDSWLNLLMTHVIEPSLGQDKPCVIYHFPASQAALAKLNPEDPRTALRFEFYYRGMELANGFEELQSATEQHQRFIANNQKRVALGLMEMPIDTLFLEALTAGLPPCSGVALGIDRLVMLATERPSIHETISFGIDNV